MVCLYLALGLYLAPSNNCPNEKTEEIQYRRYGVVDLGVMEVQTNTKNSFYHDGVVLKCYWAPQGRPLGHGTRGRGGGGMKQFRVLLNFLSLGAEPLLRSLSS